MNLIKHNFFCWNTFNNMKIVFYVFWMTKRKHKPKKIQMYSDPRALGSFQWILNSFQIMQLLISNPLDFYNCLMTLIDVESTLINTDHDVFPTLLHGLHSNTYKRIYPLNFLNFDGCCSPTTSFWLLQVNDAICGKLSFPHRLFQRWK